MTGGLKLEGQNPEDQLQLAPLSSTKALYLFENLSRSSA